MTTALRNREGMMVAVLQLPELPWPELKAAKETHERLISDKAETQQRIDELKTIADNLVTPFAEALRSGSEYDPGSQVTELNNELVALGRRLLAIDKAVTDNLNQLTETVAAKRAEWLPELDRMADKVRGEYVAAVDKAEAKQKRVLEFKAGREWVENFPDKPYRVTTLRVRLGSGTGGSTSEPRSYGFQEIFDGLRQVGS